MVAYQLRLKHFNFPKIAEVLSDNFFELHDPNTLLHVSQEAYFRKHSTLWIIYEHVLIDLTKSS